MRRKKASEIFGEVDPHLNVIDGGIGHHRPKQQEWEASGGARCPRCHQEAVRFRVQDGVCRQCADELNDKKFSDEQKRIKILGFVKAHNARIDKRKRKGTG